MVPDPVTQLQVTYSQSPVKSSQHKFTWRTIAQYHHAVVAGTWDGKISQVRALAPHKNE